MTSAPRAWAITGRRIDLTDGVLVGVLNVTPDSFSDGGEFTDPADAIARGHSMVEEGAVLVDVGGESTRPGAMPVAEVEEMRRLLPVVDGLAQAGIPVSIDTYKASVARAGVAAGASVINDVTGFRDAEMVEVAAGSDCGVVAMHMQGMPGDMYVDPRYVDVVAEVEEYLVAAAHRLEDAGVARDRIVIDPGLGFGKRAEHSLQLLSHLSRLAGHDYAVMVGASRKGFLGGMVDDDSRVGRDRATAITTALAFQSGARLFRVHELAGSRDALALAGAIVRRQ